VQAVLLLQVLGTVRAYYSWKAKELLLPEVPKPLEEEEEVEKPTLLHKLGEPPVPDRPLTWETLVAQDVRTIVDSLRAWS
jgi:hypothetical protein